MRLAAEMDGSGNASGGRGCVAAAQPLTATSATGVWNPPDAADLAHWTARANDAVEAAEQSAGDDVTGGGGSDAARAAQLATEKSSPRAPRWPSSSRAVARGPRENSPLDEWKTAGSRGRTRAGLLWL